MIESLGEAQEAIGGSMLPAIENITEAVTELGDGIANLDFGTILSGLWDISSPGLHRERPHRRMARRGRDHRGGGRLRPGGRGSPTSWARFR